MPPHRKSSAQSDAVVAALLAQPRAWQHGYALAKATGLRSGTLYPILGRLEDRGYLESKWLEPAQEGRPPRHVYRLTPAGVAFGREADSRRQYANPLLHRDGIKA
ncbi:MAG TPA: PadR family transcriptional regulator [Steroidobacteraceae bacterium]|nr:PadR family transcriptional regulator [Steroidobacteraceae bacterium]